MNVENGNIMTEEAMKALHGESVFDALKSQGKVIPVDLEDMTPEQLERFNNGDITSTVLADNRDRFTSAKTAYLGAYIEYKLAIADLKRKTLYDFELKRSLVK